MTSVYCAIFYLSFYSQIRIKVLLFSYNLSPSLVIHGNSWKKRLRGLLSTTYSQPIFFLKFR